MSAGEEYPFIHLHVQQLLALAMGADPEKVVGVQSHSQDVEPFLERIGARQPRAVMAGGAR
jgi:heterodisulfide reductase subunit B